MKRPCIVEGRAQTVNRGRPVRGRLQKLGAGAKRQSAEDQRRETKTQRSQGALRSGGGVWAAAFRPTVQRPSQAPAPENRLGE
jgi:hypothetical protein